MSEPSSSEALPVAAARGGNAQAWRALFDRFKLPLYAFAFEIIREEAAAADVVQEAFISASRNLRQLREDGRFASWLFSIAHQKCLQRLKKRGFPAPISEEVELDQHQDTAATPDEWLMDAEAAERLQEGLERLPEPHRAVVTLFFLEDFSLEEIANITGTPVGTVKSRLYYAKKTLRAWLATENAL